MAMRVKLQLVHESRVANGWQWGAMGNPTIHSDLVSKLGQAEVRDQRLTCLHVHMFR